MFSRLSAVALCLVVMSPISTRAQQPLSDSGLQQQPSPSQQTAPLQQNTPNVQESLNNPTTQTQRDSLGVVSNPGQSQPSVSVGASDTKTGIDQTDRTDNTSIYATLVVVLVFVAGIVTYLYMRKSLKNSETLQTKAPDSSQEKPQKEDIKPQKTKASSPKKKKKKAHR